MKTVGILVNNSKPKARLILQELVTLLEERGAKAWIEPDMASDIKREDLSLVVDRFPTCVDLVFVLGGDGTLLGVARQLAGHEIPILGFNLGHLGFLSEAEPDNLSVAVDRVLSGDYYIEERLMLDAEVDRDGKVVEWGIALNDIGIAKGSFSRMIEGKVFLDGAYLGTYSGDGLIVSTPTGSTAYSLSCGGPIVSPNVPCILLTPICPHTLTSRPMVLPAEGIIEIKVNATHQDIGLTIDGQEGYVLKAGDIIRVRVSSHITSLIKWRERSFFEVVRKKLQGEQEETSRVEGRK
ncbi:NAD(+)/NADH kinase [Marininema halotolerans]|uniref:NAD kinase n=1 Tax=Marininema halotolerans TaxID=1155944 RepID=A0A1I6TV08_9BACL|nr:NAD(+)/NADH kinase [Marininema halotolerans]SFS93001.1 NAD+ kinase [Marininema halotolerans]